MFLFRKSQTAFFGTSKDKLAKNSTRCQDTGSFFGGNAQKSENSRTNTISGNALVNSLLKAFSPQIFSCRKSPLTLKHVLDALKEKK